MLRKITCLVFSTIFTLATLALPSHAQNKKELSLVRLSITSQNLGSPCQGAADKVCIKINWRVNGTLTAGEIAQFRIFVDATNGNPASKNKAEATVTGDARTVTVKLFPQGSTFKITILAQDSSSQLLTKEVATGNF
jgi:hypothetical protein